MSRNEQSAADRGEQEECHDEAACGFIVTHHHHHRAASTEDNADTPTSEESNMDTEPKQEKTESVGLQSGPIKKYEAGGAVLRGFLTQRDIPPVDPAVLADLEAQARDLASNVDRMMKSLNTTIQNMTALSVGYIQTYRDSVDSLGESVDLSIKAMYTLMARTEELDKGMQPVHSLAKQIKDVKRLLDHLENLCK
ncbi:BLOC-1-related complex subunit 6-like isoform X6 [Petromyzon marinus]|uniref:BLOC-1-related complex subunit 6-like isoform X6 n=1 Tax=Petromyzon marinus TaxID=7757 RepID=A0AAJ7T8W9_PETMA|nr:BLOC-1-related complex subunit 6-like isoform X6 [Petromyzon marinus]